MKNRIDSKMDCKESGGVPDSGNAPITSINHVQPSAAAQGGLGVTS